MDVVNGDITFKANEKLNMPANPQKIGFKFRGYADPERAGKKNMPNSSRIRVPYNNRF